MTFERFTASTRPAVLGAAVAACVVLLPCSVRADSLTFSSMAGCPSREAFVARVRAHTPLARFDDHTGRSFFVSLRGSRAAEPFLGSLELRDPEGARTTREVDGGTCEEVSDALSLIVALAIDPNAVASIRPPLGSIEQSPPKAVPTPSSVPRTAQPSPTEVARPRGVPPNAPLARSTETRLAFELSSGLGAAPSPTLGAGIDLAIERSVDRSRRGMALVLGGYARAVVEKTVFGATLPSVDMVRVLGSFGPCPFEAHAGALRVETCVGLGLGVARFEGEGAPNPSVKVRFWSHAEAGLRASVAISRWTFFRLRATLELPLVRDELVFVRPDVFVHRASAVTGSFGASFGIRL